MNPEFTAYPLPQNYTFSAAVRSGPMLVVSGMTATDENREIIGTDLETQCRYIFEKMGKVLEEAGASFADVIETVDYVTTFDGYGKTADVRREVFGAGYLEHAIDGGRDQRRPAWVGKGGEPGAGVRKGHRFDGCQALRQGFGEIAAM